RTGRAESRRRPKRLRTDRSSAPPRTGACQSSVVSVPDGRGVSAAQPKDRDTTMAADARRAGPTANGRKTGAAPRRACCQEYRKREGERHGRMVGQMANSVTAVDTAAPAPGKWLPAVALAWFIPGGGHFLLKRSGRGG